MPAAAMIASEREACLLAYPDDDDDNDDIVRSDYKLCA